VKARIRQVQRAMLRQRMLTAVPKADVVITNPTHIAVALRYNQDEMAAPYVIAKGERLLAQRIKEIAREHNVPVIEDKPLARALFKICEVGQMVPANLYRAVAEILAYVYRLRGKGVNSNG
jgi:flagellar biosynthetic protein FlhB